MKICIYGGAGFIGTNLIKRISKEKIEQIIVLDKCADYFCDIKAMGFSNVKCVADAKFPGIDFDDLLSDIDVVFHLMSTSMPSNTNSAIGNEINMNISESINLFDSCIKNNVKKIIFISSGGTVYGKTDRVPISEFEQNFPITAYGIQKLTIEKLIYLYWHLHGLNYGILRLANPYGPYQRPNGILGAVTTFTYEAMLGHKIKVFGNGKTIRDYIYIDDAIEAIINIMYSEDECKLYNIGSGIGYSLKDIIREIENIMNKNITIEYMPARNVDVPVNILDVSRYESRYGKCAKTSLSDGIKKTIDYLSVRYSRRV